MDAFHPITQPTQATQLAELYRTQDNAALRAQIHLQNLPGGPF